MSFKGEVKDYDDCKHAVQFNDVSTSNEPSYERSDATITVRSRWTPDHLWILYEVQGDKIQFEAGESEDVDAWRCDALDVYLDPRDNNDRNYVNGEARSDDRHIAYNLSEKIAGFGVRVEVREDESRVAIPESLPRTEELLKGTRRTTPDHYTLEVRVAWEWLLGEGIIPPEGTLMGALFAFMDCDKAICGTRHSQNVCRHHTFSWAIGMDENFATRADQWGGHLELVGAPDP